VSEGVWVVIGTAVGALVGSIATLCGIMIQTRARRAETERQLEYQKRQAEVARLIEVRASYIDPIRKHLQRLSEYSMVAGESLHIIAQPEGDYPPLGSLFKKRLTHEEAMNSLQESAKGIQTASSEIQQLMPRVSDKRLADLLAAVQISILGVLSNAEWIFLSEIDKKDDINAVAEFMNELRDNVTEANRRTEELLSGMD